MFLFYGHRIVSNHFIVGYSICEKGGYVDDVNCCRKWVVVGEEEGRKGSGIARVGTKSTIFIKRSNIQTVSGYHKMSINTRFTFLGTSRCHESEKHESCGRQNNYKYTCFARVFCLTWHSTDAGRTRARGQGGCLYHMTYFFLLLVLGLEMRSSGLLFFHSLVWNHAYKWKQVDA